MDSQTAGNYNYDDIGNLVKDRAEEIDKIEWTLYGKVASVIRKAGSKKPDLYFYYDGAGRRYLKVNVTKKPDGSLADKNQWKAVHYQHDAQGNILAVYDIKGITNECGYDLFLGQHVLYGSARLGVSNYDKLKLGRSSKTLAYPSMNTTPLCTMKAESGLTPDVPFDWTVLSGGTGKELNALDRFAALGQGTVITVHNYPLLPGKEKPQKLPTLYLPGKKQYEFGNHLSNVLVTVSDMPKGVDNDRNGIAEYYMPDVLSTSDYEPFGAPLAERTFGQGSFHYTETLNVVTQILLEDFNSLSPLKFEENFNVTPTEILAEDFTPACDGLFYEDFSAPDTTLFGPHGTTTLSYTGKLNFSTATGTGHGLLVTLPTVAGRTYTAEFDLVMETPATISYATLYVPGQNQLLVGTSHVAYTFTAGGSHTQLILTLTGTGTKTASVDNFGLCEQARDYSYIKQYGTVYRLDVDSTLSFWTNAGSGVRFDLPTEPGASYALDFDYVPSANISSVVLAGQSYNLYPYPAAQHLTVTFKATGAESSVLLVPTGTSVLKSKVDNLRLVKLDRDVAPYLPSGTINGLSFQDGGLVFKSYTNDQGLRMNLPTESGYWYYVYIAPLITTYQLFKLYRKASISDAFSYLCHFHALVRFIKTK